jgi:predicted esterase
MKSVHRHGLVSLAAALCAVGSAALAQPIPAKGATEWIPVASGKLKVRTFTSPAAGQHPILIVVLHGDAPFARPSYQYEFAERAAGSGDVVAAAILRPGYADPSGDASSGDRGLTTGDNYTRDRIDMIVAAVRQLQARHHARATVLVGHSGGAAIVADILGLYPDLARRALLASCPCDLPAWRAYMKSVHPTPLWDEPVESLSPVDFATRVPRRDEIVLMVGGEDATAPPRFTQAYADALRKGGVRAEVDILPGRDHEVLLDPAVVQRLQRMIGSMTAGD